MANVLLAWPNRIDTTLSLYGGNYSPNLPLSNAKNRVIAKKARTVDTAEASSFFIATFPEGRPVNVVAIAGHNFTTQATFRVRLYSEASLTTLIYDSGYVNVWPALYSTNELEWEYNNWWEGTITDTDRQNYTPLAFNINTGLYLALGMRVDIKDTSNPYGYLEFGRVFIGESFQPSINMQYGASISHEISTSTELTLSNNEYFDVRTPRRTASFQLAALDKTEAVAKTYTMQRQQGIHGEIFFSYDPDVSQEMYVITFLGRLQSIDPISQPYVDRFSTGINLIEIL